MSEVSTHITPSASIALLGFGEAGAALAEGWRSVDPSVRLNAFDIKAASVDNAVSASMWDRYRAHEVSGCDQLSMALAGSSAVFSVVTADQSHDAAREAARHIAPETLFFDCNSCAPETKRASAEVIEAAGGYYVDTAVMSPVHPKRHQSPMLVSGPHSARAAEFMEDLGMAPRVIEGDVGRASSIKMLRSVMIKGLEALTLESLLAARKAGVDDEVIASLDASMPGWDWAVRAAYNLERTTTHGIRRAAEMREVARTVADLGLPARMSASIVEWQQDMGDLGIAPGSDDFKTRANAILAALETEKREDTR